MAQFKCRAWDEEAKTMLSWEELQEEWEKEGYFDSVFREDHWKCLHYIGLKDRNGVEVYEGDVVRLCTMDEDFKSLEEIMQLDCGLWYLGTKEHDGLYDAVNYSELNIEVVGNIYEHPELLKTD